MDTRERRELRVHKRLIKRLGNQRLRRAAKRAISESPNDFQDLTADYGRYRFSDFNGMDRDATRRRHHLDTG